MHQKIKAVQKEAVQGTAQSKDVSAEVMDGVVNKVSERWLASIDKEEPEIVDEFLKNMKDSIAEIHATEGYPKGKILQARDGGDDWLVKVVEANKKMQALIPPSAKENRVAVFDS